MTKTHKVRVIIFNKSGLDMIYKEDKYYHGEIAPSSRKWMDIKNDDVGDFLSQECDYSILGCSGYVTYRIGDEILTIAFSNPEVGANKLNVGTGVEGVWESMSSLGYDKFERPIDGTSGNGVTCDCQCTPGRTNVCVIILKRDRFGGHEEKEQ